MKTKYIVGFFAAILIFGVLLTAGYQISYDRVAERSHRLEMRLQTHAA